MNINTKYKIGEVVYFITDTEENKPYIVTEIRITPNGLNYVISNNGDGFVVYEIEIRNEVQFKTITNE